MFGDLRALPDGSTIECDLCVIGAGAAGITLAKAFAGGKLAVILVEAGGLTRDDLCQSLYEGGAPSQGLFYPPLEIGRLRYFGGTTNHWTGYCAPFTRLDLRERPWVPHSGWPLSWDELLPYYHAAQGICQLARFAYEPRLWAAGERFPAFLDKLDLGLWQFSPPTRFARTYGAILEDAQNVQVLFHANATELLTDESGRKVEALAVQSLEGKKASVRSKTFVLASGGIENARLLLMSDRHRPQGIGNEHDLVGRFFQDHVETVTARGFVTVDSPPPLAGFIASGVVMLPLLALSEKSQEQGATLACAVSIEPPPKKRPSGYVALRRTLLSLLAGRRPKSLNDDMVSVLMDFDGIAQAVVHRLAGGPRAMPPTRRGMPIVVKARCEQAPDPDNRVVLTDHRDALGLRKVQLRWRVGEPERETLRHATRLVAEELGRLKLARLQIVDWLAEGAWPTAMNQGYHHIGTTRMAADPRLGVVDARCKVHEVDNLFVAGSSVFPTSSYAPPTLTIVALALRLADHLRDHLV